MKLEGIKACQENGALNKEWKRNGEERVNLSAPPSAQTGQQVEKRHDVFVIQWRAVFNKVCQRKQRLNMD
ncbi:hypothetical protein ATANTOWER_008205 [Ataeniobius toweri]|uniref:Uncharacterized protein n=1 Tax=Ataeniobius toweri TaxID=208326 RepID=A0ABU7C6K2_9TELE|nr:hypothetical protein [Ataeniobius toweri]